MNRAEMACRGNKALPCFAADDIFAFLDDNQNVGGGNVSWLFYDIRQIVECEAPAKLDTCLKQLSAGLTSGLYAVALLTYELGYCLEPKLTPLNRQDRSLPLFTILLFGRALRVNHGECAAVLQRAVSDAGPAAFQDIRPNMSKQAYCDAVRAVKGYIREGDVYQVNLTFKYLFRYFGEPVALYTKLRSRQRVRYGAFVRMPKASVLSLSPELFIRKSNGTVVAKPMKGTARRGENAAVDALLRTCLQQDAKNRAENVMIVDLIRNDLGRIAHVGSVAVKKLFEVESYETLFQMTSTVTAKVDPLISMRDLLGALYPCGSITGAPKIRAMEIIRELEVADRGLYTGAIGYVLPGNDFCFNVAIRTAVLSPDGSGELGIGSGIIDDSDAEAEYEECLLKGEFLTGVDPEFKHLEGW